MLDISMVRVDERLIHGQILIKWIQVKNASRILIIDNDVANDPVMKNILNMSVPESIDLDIYDLKEGIKVLTSDKPGDNVIVLVRNLWVVRSIHLGGVQIKEVNIGRLSSGTGKKRIHPNVFLSDRDIDIIDYFKQKDIPVVIQAVPDSSPIVVHDLI